MSATLAQDLLLLLQAPLLRLDLLLLHPQPRHRRLLLEELGHAADVLRMLHLLVVFLVLCVCK